MRPTGQRAAEDDEFGFVSAWQESARTAR